MRWNGAIRPARSATDAGLAATGGTRADRAGLGAHPAGVDAAAIRSRGDLAQLPVTRKSDLKELQTRESPLAASTPRRHGNCAAVRLARPDLRSRRPWRRLVALASPMKAPACRPAHPAELLCLSLHAGGLHGRGRGGAPGLRGDPGRHRPDRMQVNAMAA
jgi:phenylacetate-CoA ligase